MSLTTSNREETSSCTVHSVPSWKQFLREPLARANRESQAYLATPAGQQADRKVITILVSAALCLTIQRYLGGGNAIEPLANFLGALGFRGLGDSFCEIMLVGKEAEFRQLTWWVGITLLFFVAVPVLTIRWGFGERVGDYGIKLHGAFADFWVYGVMLAIAWPFIFLFSAEASFLATYPFLHLEKGESLWPYFWCWEVLYFFQFLGVEFFFRGFLLHGLRQRFGAYAIVIMMVPYCMLHFRKPMPECLASIIGALVLGFMSLRTRSIWMGTAIHITIAGLMDGMALWRQGFLFG
jgi:membrane protease YdiL (CAAX protease family)